MRTFVVFISCAVICMLAGISVGIGIGLMAQPLSSNQTEIVYVDRVVEVSTIVYQDKIIEIPKEVIKEVPSQLKDWNSLEELQNFLIQDDTDKTIFYHFPDMTIDTGACEKYVLMLIDNASIQGKRLFFCPQSLLDGNYHALVGVIVGNDFYLIEPQTDAYWLLGYLD